MSAESLQKVDPKTLKRWLDEDMAVLIDVREADEYAREHIPQARHVPLSGFSPSDFPNDYEKIGVFHCQSGTRTAEAAPRILQTGFSQVCELDGGLKGCRLCRQPQPQGADLDHAPGADHGRLAGCAWHRAGASGVALVHGLECLCGRRANLCRRVGNLRHGVHLGPHAVEQILRRSAEPQPRLERNLSGQLQGFD